MSASSKKRIGCWGLPHPKENGVSYAGARHIELQIQFRFNWACVCYGTGICYTVCVYAGECVWMGVSESVCLSGRVVACDWALLHCIAASLVALSLKPRKRYDDFVNNNNNKPPSPPPPISYYEYSQVISHSLTHTKYIAASCRQLMPIGAH